MSDRDQSAKADAGKTNPLLLEKDFAAALSVVNAVLDYGAQKYERSSWRTVELDRWDEAHRRHQKAIDLAVTSKCCFDHESGLLHRAHQITGLVIMLQKEIEASGRSLEELCSFNPPPQAHKKKRKTRSDVGQKRKEVSVQDDIGTLYTEFARSGSGDVGE